MDRPASGDDNRIHTEAPAEGDSAREFPEIRAHSQDPVEGPDTVNDGVPAGAAAPEASREQPE